MPRRTEREPRFNFSPGNPKRKENREIQKEITTRAQTARIFEWRLGFDAIFLINIGVRLGLFRAFAQTPGATPQEIAAALGLHEPYVEVWCTTAYALELLEVDGNSKFYLAPSWKPILADATDPHYLGSLVQTLAEFTSEDFRQSLDGFRSGKTVPFQGRGNSFAALVAGATAGLHFLVIRKVLPLLPNLFDSLNRGGTILDVGCGNGRLLIQLAEAFPKSRCLGIDIDQTGLTLARAAIQEARVSDRVAILEGDIGTIAQANFVDLAVMIEVLHEIAPAQRPKVIQGCARVLRPGGWLVILDETYPSTLDEVRQPEFRLPLQTGFEELMWGNIIPTRHEQESLLRQAGFTGEIHRTRIGEGLTLLTTQRSEIV